MSLGEVLELTPQIDLGALIRRFAILFGQLEGLLLHLGVFFQHAGHLRIWRGLQHVAVVAAIEIPRLLLHPFTVKGLHRRTRRLVLPGIARETTTRRLPDSCGDLRD